MTIQTINIGTTANDGTGDPLRTALDKVNDNFTDTTNAASRLVTTSATDTTAGRLLEVGNFGVGASTVPLVSGADFDSYTTTGVNVCISSGINAPNTGMTYTLSVLPSFSAGRIIQIAHGTKPNQDEIQQMYIRYRDSGGNWTSWQEILHTGNTGDSVTYDVTTSATDTTAGRLLKVGDGGVVKPINATSSDVNTLIDQAIYMGNNLSNLPSGVGNGWCVIEVFENTNIGGNQIHQILSTPNYVSGSNKKFFRNSTNSGGSWSDWFEILHTGNMVGTVSQSGGVPTGAVIERGSNANGEYVKFADGTLVCWGTLPDARTLPDGNDVGLKSASFSFAASFVSTTYTVYFNNESIGENRAASLIVHGSARTGNGKGTATNIVYYELIGALDSANYICFTAIGRWY